MEKLQIHHLYYRLRTKNTLYNYYWLISQCVSNLGAHTYPVVVTGDEFCTCGLQLQPLCYRLRRNIPSYNFYWLIYVHTQSCGSDWFCTCLYCMY